MQPEDVGKVTEITQQLLQAPINNLALFIAVLALVLLIAIVYVGYRFAPRFVRFLESLTTSYSKMVENLEKLTIVESQNAAISEDVKAVMANTKSEVATMNTNLGTLLTVGSAPVQRIDAALDIIARVGTPPVQRIDANVAAVVEQIEVVKDIAIATADLTNASQEAILTAFTDAVKELKAAIQKRKTDSQPIATISAENGETKNEAA